jgi:hypothetical protein
LRKKGKNREKRQEVKKMGSREKEEENSKNQRGEGHPS